MKKDKPVQAGKTYPLDIENMGDNGEGIGRIEGYTIFVEDAVPGDSVEVEIVLLSRNFARGRLRRILLPSEQRAEARCPMALSCGGCQIQHMDYRWQLKHKTRRVVDSIRRIGGLEGVAVHPTIGMADPWRYRNKAQFPVGEEDGRVKAGFFARQSHNIVEIDDCMIQQRISGRIIKGVKNWMEDCGIPPYDETTGQGIVRHVITRAGFTTGDIMVIIVAACRYFPGKDKLVGVLVEEIPGLKSVILNINDRKTNVILGKECITLWGKGYITDFIGSLEFRISPLSFFQINPVQTAVLYDRVLEYANLTGDETVIDAYCGIGTISLFLAGKAGKVYGIEVVEEAVKDARTNARINGIENAQFIAGQAEDIMPGMYGQGIMPEVIVVDPPRKGCGQRLLDTIASMEPGRVVYVSCNPATLARDLKYLDGRGYKAVEVQPVDMFPHTGHVECVVLMSRVED